MNKNLTEEEFDELIYDDEERAVIFFHKEGCSACHDVSIELEGLENFNSWTFAKVDALKERNLFSRFGLNGVPQVLLFQNSNLIRILSGKKSKAEYKNALEFFDDPNENILPERLSTDNKCSQNICYFADAI
ncbi:MAG: thioredoxin family protein [Synergistaceae bacterium]|nr:thioredoxin family protein [Synergistaceae bacterium]